MSEMQFNSSVSPTELYARMITRVEDKFTDIMLKYLQIFEEEQYNMLIDQIPDKIDKLISTGKVKKAKAEVQRLESIWTRIHKDITAPKEETDCAKIHILKKQLKLSTYNYRNVLMQEAGKQSSATMRKFEIALAKRGMRLYAAGKLKVIPWDKDETKA